MGVDNIEIDADGILWVGGHPNLLRFKAYAQGKKETAPSEIIKIDYKGKGDFTVENNRINVANIDVFTRDPVNFLRIFT